MATESIITAEGEVTYFCSVCDGVLDDNVMCDCQEYAVPETRKHSFNVACQECGYSGSMERVALHSCDIAQNGGKCEDFPCCGHTDGDGCQTLPEHTADYWMDLMTRYPENFQD